MKPWANEIQQHITIWENKLRVKGLEWWPHFVYHFTDVNNAVEILKSGFLYSRAEAVRLGLMHIDNASPEIIAHTVQEYQQFVRLYFRPLTPTQYRNEGIRPKGERKLGAHCPIPIFFFFDTLSILTLDDTNFSNGNMGTSYVLYNGNRDFFFQIPFDKVFHEGPYSPDQQDIKFHRHAEVLVPGKLSLDKNLKFIICRSAAERQTLLHLLPDSLRDKWTPFVRLKEKGVFHRKWTFVEEVVVSGGVVYFRLNPNSLTHGPYEVRFEYTEIGTTIKRSAQGILQNQRENLTNATIPVSLSGATEGFCTLYLDDALAFAGKLNFNDIPF